jgi:hypothetical protein
MAAIILAARNFECLYCASARLEVRANETGASFWFGEEHDPVVRFDPIGAEEYLEDA